MCGKCGIDCHSCFDIGLKGCCFDCLYCNGISRTEYIYKCEACGNRVGTTSPPRKLKGREYCAQCYTLEINHLRKIGEAPSRKIIQPTGAIASITK